MRFAATAALLFVAACGSDPLVPEDVVGTYALHTVNLEPLPFSYRGPTGGIEILSGSLEMRGNYTFSRAWTSRDSTKTVVGIYELSGSRVWFEDDDSPIRWRASLGDGTLTMRIWPTGPPNLMGPWVYVRD